MSSSLPRAGARLIGPRIVCPRCGELQSMERGFGPIGAKRFACPHCGVWFGGRPNVADKTREVTPRP